jgi:23S rRNA (guanine745-N1)-methyltransferase
VHPLRQEAYRALRCPFCRADLETVGRSLRCANRHNFDLARSGYVNLRPGRKAGRGDARDQLGRRASFLATGAFDFIADAILARLPARRQISRVLDVGCGTGYHLDRIARGLRPDCRGLGLDGAKEAARMAAQRHASLGFVVADIWADWPLQSAAADLLISIFAPKNFAEMARVLSPGGEVAVVYPGPQHLLELRQALGLIGIRPGKGCDYRHGLQDFARDIAHDRIVRTVPFHHGQALDLILMGPNARHLSATRIPRWSGARPVTFDLELLTATRRT